MTRPKHPDSIGALSQNDPQKLAFIKSEIFRVYKDFESRGIYGTLRMILRGMDFWVHEELGARLFRELLTEGLVPPRRERVKYLSNSFRRRGDVDRYLPKVQEILEATQKIKEENAASMGCLGLGEIGLPKTPDKMSPEEVSRWARKRYEAAWKAILEIRPRKTGEPAPFLSVRHEPGDRYLASGSAEFGREGRFIRTVDGW